MMLFSLKPVLQRNTLPIKTRVDCSPCFFGSIGPLQLSHHVTYFSYKYGLELNECQIWREHVEKIKMAKFEVPIIKEREFMTV